MGKYGDEVKSSLERAEVSLQTAKDLLEQGQYNDSAARASEAAFHSSSALLWNEEIEPGQQGDVLSLVQQNFVEKHRLTKEQGEKLNWLFQLGETAKSGAAAPLHPGEAQKAVQFTVSFFDAVKVILEP